MGTERDTLETKALNWNSVVVVVKRWSFYVYFGRVGEGGHVLEDEGGDPTAVFYPVHTGERTG